MTTKDLVARHQAQQSLIIIGQIEGGVGKTYIAALLDAVFTACGLKAKVLDLDYGNRAASTLMQEVEPVHHRATRSVASMIIGDLSRFDAIVGDLGANLLTDGQYKALCDELIRCAQEEGRQVTFLVPVIPNKGGFGEMGKKVATEFSSTANVVLILNNVDGSSDFPPVDGFQLLPLAHTAAGYTSARMSHAGPILDFILNGDAEFSLARGYWAQYLLRFMAQPSIAQMLPPVEDQPILVKLRSMPAPGDVFYHVSNRRAARDDMLRANFKCRQTFDAFVLGDTGTGLLERALACHAATNAYHGLKA